MNSLLFQNALESAYTELFTSDSRYAYVAANKTPKELAERMVQALKEGKADLQGEGTKRACKACGVKQTRKALMEYINS